MALRAQARCYFCDFEGGRSLRCLAQRACDCASHDLAALFGVDIAPACRAQADRLSIDRRWRQFSTRNVEYFECQVDHDFWRQVAFPHDAA